MKAGFTTLSVFSGILVAHVAAVYIWLVDQPDGGAILSEQVSLSVNIAQMPQIVSQPLEVIEVAPEPEKPEPKPEPETLKEAPTVETVTTEKMQSEPVQAVVEKAVLKPAPRPKLRSRKVEKKPALVEVAKKEPPKKQQPKKVQTSQPKSQISATKTAPKVAQSMGSKTDKQAILTSYFGQLQAHIAKHKLEGLGRQGVVIVRFEMNKSGVLLASDIRRTSGNQKLDRVALKSLKNASPFPVPPGILQNKKLVFSIPYLFK